MKRRDLVTAFLVSTLVRLAMATLIPRPGYMDTAYYAAGAIRIALGDGFSEPFIWNYLNDPTGIPHPGFLYWMPLPSLLAAPFAAVLPGSFFALQVPFIFLSALVPLVAHGLTWQATGRRRLAWTGGLLALFSGFFFPYWTLPETFAPFVLFGSLALWLAGRATGENGEGRTEMGGWGGGDGVGDGDNGARHGDNRQRNSGRRPADKGSGPTGGPGRTRDASDRAANWGGQAANKDGLPGDGGDRNRIGDCGRWLVVGALVGLAHLTRADGILLLPVVILGPFLTHYVSRFTHRGFRVALRQSLFLLLGYLLVMAPWFARNLAAIGTPLSPAGTKTVWLTQYDDLFCYGCDLSPSSYLAWGWGNILRSKLSALWINAQRLLAEGGLVFLLPFALAGFYRLRRRLPFLLASLFLVAIYLGHSLVFTFPGWRGGFFHASAAVLPFLYAAGIEGLDGAVRWVSKRRRAWRYQQAQVVFVAAAVAAAVALSGYMAWQKIPAWRTADAVYEEVDRWLADHGAVDAGVMVGNPPAFWYHTDRPPIVIPNGDVATLVEVADRYDMGYVLLESNHPAALADLHAGQVQHPRLTLLNTWSEGKSILYAVEP